MFGQAVRAVPRFLIVAALWLMGRIVMRMLGKEFRTIRREARSARTEDGPVIKLVRDPQTGIYRPGVPPQTPPHA